MTSTIDNSAMVVFSPSGRRGRFERGTSVLQAARRLGVDIDSVCGGRGLCGRCQVDVTEGDLPKFGIVSDADNLSVCGETEILFREQSGMAEGRRLSCLANIEGDLAIDVPATSQLHRQLVRKPFEAHDIDIDPIVHRYFVEVGPPNIHKPGGDLQRLFTALKQEWQLDDLSCALPVKQQLQQVLRIGDRKITVAVRDGREVVAVWPGLHDHLYGVAVDVGSTTVAMHLCDLQTGDVLASAGRMNPQIRFGEDLMSRVSYIMMHPGSERELTGVVRDLINELIVEVTTDCDIDVADVVEMTIVGNPIMQHLVLGISPVELGAAPYTLANDASVTAAASELGITINPGGYVYVLPCIAGHVGADTAGVLLAEAPQERDDISLIVDVGTNAELLLGNHERLLAASSPTGPAFEGAEISSGQRAAPGAIERVRIDRESLEPRFKVIGCNLWSDDPQFPAQLPSNEITGICGSGIIEVVAEMFLSGIIDKSGKFVAGLADRSSRVVSDGNSFEYVLHDSERRICIKQRDVRAIQLAKAALYAGARLLMQKLGIDRVDRIRLAGAFGAHIDTRYAMVLGMIPDCARDAVSSAGNAAGTGAIIALLDKNSRPRVEELVRNIEKIETAVQKDFQELYVDAMPIPHHSDVFRELEMEEEL